MRRVKSRIHLLLAVSLWCICSRAIAQDDPAALVLVPGANEIERSREGYAEGCYNLRYTLAASFPGDNVRGLISDRLQTLGWKPRPKGKREAVELRKNDFLRADGSWRHFKTVAGSQTYVRAYVWHNAAGDVVTYRFWYFTPQKNSLRVEARYCSKVVIDKYTCVPLPRPAHDEKDYALQVDITDVEAVNTSFKVSVRIENSGIKPVLIGVEEALPDGKPRLWVLGLEQEEDAEWGSVDAVCPEHPALDWITLKPGDSLESWEMAVDFPEPDHWFGMCQRHIGHLRGRIRASIRFYTNTCEILDPFKESAPYIAVSKPVELPSQAR